MAITEEEKKERRETVQMDLNIVGSGFGGQVCKELQDFPAHEQWINGEISKEEYMKAINDYINSLRK